MLALNEQQRQLLRHVHINMPWRYLERYLPLVLEYRLNLELGFEAGVLDEYGYDDYRKTAQLLRNRGCRLTMHGPFRDLCPGAGDPLIRQASRLRLSQLFDLVEIFEPQAIVCHTGFDPRHHGEELEEWMERALHVWQPLAMRARQHRVPLLLENVWEAGPELHRELLDRIDSTWCGFCLDVGHQHTFSRTALDRWLDVLGDRLGEVHLHDNDGSRDAHLPVASGTVNFSVLFDFLLERESPPVMTLEPHEEKHLAESLDGLVRLVPERFWPALGGEGRSSVEMGDEYKLTASGSSTMEV